jgi:CBS domain-containing protein
VLRQIASMMKREVHQLPPTSSVYRAACLMKEKSCGAVVVTAEARLKGIFTSGDLVKRVTAAKLNPARTKLAEVMTQRPDTVGPTTLAIDALRMMQDGHYRHLPVVEKGRLVGIISRRDFFGQEQSIVDEEDHLAEIIW